MQSVAKGLSQAVAVAAVVPAPVATKPGRPAHAVFMYTISRATTTPTSSQ
ncbi:MAG TPA: hypothetical protein VFZ71_03815 [Pyrinomonadaceae bacterium]